MQPVTRHDIEILRRRINASVSRTSGGSEPSVRTASQLTSPKHPPPPATIGIASRECESELGRFVVQEHLIANKSSHGNVPVARLRDMAAQWAYRISRGDIDPSPPRRWAFLDTETTGLAGGTGTCAFLVGVGAIEEGGFRVKLYFMRDYDEEAAMLGALADHLDRYKVLLTYNGKAFDVPLLETRFRLKRMRSPLATMGHIDLLHGARRLWRERMPDCRLGTLESEILGFERHGDIPGSLIPQRYFEFLRTRQWETLRPVFHHNMLDIVSLACLSSVIMSSYAEPDRAPLRHGQDLLGLARWLGKSGNDATALRLYRKAIQAGLPASGLFRGLWEAAQIERRSGNHVAKVELLRDLSRAGGAYRVEALEALAKHYEHLEKDLEQALELTRAAQCQAASVELSHRESRLRRKIAASRASVPGGSGGAAST